MIARRTIAVAALAAVVTSVSLASSQAAEPAEPAPYRRPNILWIVSDDLSPDLGCYGEPVVSTPNLDRLATEGMRFEYAFTTAPVCSASRSAFFTGAYQTTTGAHNHRSHRGDGYQLPGGVRLLHDVLREAGYFVTSTTADKSLGTNDKTDFNFEYSNVYDGTDWRQCPAGQPFFAYANIKEPHRGFVKPDATAHPVDPAAVALPPFYPDHPLVRRDWADYLNTVQVLDDKVGRILARLEADGLAGNTVVIFFGDHGRPHIRGKQFLYDEGIRVPLIVRWPDNRGAVPPGSVNANLVSAIDITATTRALAGAPRSEWLQGRSFLGEDVEPRDAIFAARDRCDGTVDRIRAVRTARFKYVRNYMPDRAYTQFNRYKETSYPMLALMRELASAGQLNAVQAAFMAESRPAEELYDLEADPHELVNLAADPAYAEVLNEMRGRLDAWIAETHDQGETPEDPAVAKREYEEMMRQYQQQAR